MGELLSRLPITFGRPWWLVGLVLLVPVVWVGLRGLSGLGAVRRAGTVGLRAVVVVLLVLALADARGVRRNEALTVMFLLDVSESVPGEWQSASLDFVNRAVERYRRKVPGDWAGVIAFGWEPRVEVPPMPDPPPLARIENRIEGDATDLAAALKLALATFPEETARRIVVVSDGNENRGRALEQALVAAGLKVQIDVVPIEYRYDDEVLVEKVAVPPDAKQGDTVEVSVVLRAAAPTRGTLQVYQRVGGRTVPVQSEPVPVGLERGVNVRTLRQRIDEANFYTFTAEFVPEAGSGDQRRLNNAADGFVYARGSAHVLLIEGSRGEHEELVQALRSKQMQVTTLTAPTVTSTGIESGDPLPSELAELQPYDAVILANVPRDSFTDAQIQMLETNCHDLGAGLIMIGGPNSFGAGKWVRTPVEQALPVEMEIKDQKIVGKSAVVMVMHASEIPEGNYWQKVVCQQALKTLSPYDMAGVLYWQGQEAWLFTLQNIGERMASMLRAIDRMIPGDMPDADPSLQMGLGALRRSDAMTKHFIVISDGDPTPPTPQTIAQLRSNKITVTSVLVAAHGGDVMGASWMQNLAQQTGGRFYNVQNPKALPRIYQKEARLISRPLIYEREAPWRLTVNTPDADSELISGLSAESLPAVSGIVLTSRKENPLVKTPLASPQPGGQFNPVLAHWTYGLGRAVAFTSDAGRKWATAWPTWEGYTAFWWQVVRWALRPLDDRELTLSLRRENGTIKVVVDALDQEDQFVNYLQFQGVVVRPELDGEGRPRKQVIPIVQTAPGRYEGVIEGVEARGNYFVSLGYVGADGKTGLISGGVSVPYSEEYRELRSNAAALEDLARATGGRVHRWVARADGRGVDLERTLDGADVFRRDPGMVQPQAAKALWPLLLFWASLLFLGDVAIRRLAPDVRRWARALADGWTRLRGAEVPERVEYMEKLRGSKAAARAELERARAAVRFEPPVIEGGPEAEGREGQLEGRRSRAMESLEAAESPRAGWKRPPTAPPPAALEPSAGESYTERLRQAKQRAWRERGRGDSDAEQG
ncbi:MAG: hypothetical protein KatS3mg108_2744 [Isosphaeraceae bacterium]|jgi:uncharacterized membrane protein/Mg-chelatase subunit ChlD|nr:MAG: hypothetical protein KatS3mg108_2744 [Isosphaeraceae bacterium]